MAGNHWRIMLQTPACFFGKQAGVCSTSGYVSKKAGGMFLHRIFYKILRRRFFVTLGASYHIESFIYGILPAFYQNQ
jgi:hypothetical protein